MPHLKVVVAAVVALAVLTLLLMLLRSQSHELADKNLNIHTLSNRLRKYAFTGNGSQSSDSEQEIVDDVGDHSASVLGTHIQPGSFVEATLRKPNLRDLPDEKSRPTAQSQWSESKTNCDACPVFISMAASSKDERTTSGMRGSLRSVNSTNMFLHTIQATSHSIGNAHRCFKFYIYTDDAVIMQNIGNLELGESVQARTLPDLPANVYDLYEEYRSKNCTTSIHDMNQTDIHIGQSSREWISMSRTKLDLVKLHLDVGEKVIWIDLDTLIVADFSCFYLLPNFVIAPGFWQAHFNILNDYMPFPLPTHTPPGSVKVKRKGRQYDGYQGIPRQHFVFGDLWMADQALIDAALAIEQELFQKGLFATFDVQHYFSLLHYRNMKGLHDLNRETDMCWGTQFVEGNRLPWAKYRMHLGGVGEDLYCTKTCKKVGALSFNWASFQVMRTAPCLYFKESTGALVWFRKNVVRWNESVLGYLENLTTCTHNSTEASQLVLPHRYLKKCITVEETKLAAQHFLEW